MSEHLDIWVKARALIAEQRHWCKGTVARDAAGRLLRYDSIDVNNAVLSPDAVSFCLAGAMGRAAGDYNEGMKACIALAYAAELPWQDRHMYPGGFNDSSSHAEVLALIDRGIASARASRTLPSLLDIPPSPTRVNETV